MNWDAYWSVMGAIGIAAVFIALLLLWGWISLVKFDWPDWVYWALPVALLVLGLPVAVGLTT